MLAPSQTQIRDAADVQGAFERNDTEVTVTVPASLVGLIGQVMGAISRGEPVLLGHMPAELTTTAAAAFLGMSRPTLMKHVKRGDIPSHAVGTHTRLKAADVLEFQRKMREKQRADFEDLLALDAALGITE